MSEAPAPATALPEALLEPGAYSHPIDDITLVETHISWVFLAGDFAYKVKKPVRLAFLDFSTAELRRHFCDEELRLNRRHAPAIYLGLSRIARLADGSIALDGNGETIDWAVRMRRFDRDQQLDQLIERGAIDPAELYDFGSRLATLHASAPAATAEMEWCRPDRMIESCLHSTRQLADLWPEAGARLGLIDRWAEDRWQAAAAQQHERHAAGLFRECHSDLHCGNVVRIEGRLTPFDALEFDPSLSWIDPVNDLAFLLMDLDARGRPDLAATLLDGWLAARGDFEALAPLRLFQCYRALVRALTAGLRAQQRRDDSNAAAARARYLAAAERQVTTSRPKLIVVGGVSGAGKSWVAERLIGALGAVRVRSDVERKRIAGLGALGDSGGRIYSPELTRRTYARLGDAASKILEAGFPAIVDAACLMRAERDALRARARALGLSCRLVWVTAPVDVLAARITARRAAGRDPSEATVDVMRTQQHFVQPPGADELADGLILDTGAGIDLGVVTAALRR